MKHFSIVLTLSVLLTSGGVCLLQAADNITQQTIPSKSSTAAPAPAVTQASPKPKIVIKDSELCKTCLCSIEYLQIDCSKQSRSSLFSDAEWETLQSGDVLFEIIKMDHNNISAVPVLPPYPVKALYLGFNNISEIAVGAFQNLEQLTALDLSHNKLTPKSLSPHVFKGKYAPDKYEPFKSLKRLNLAYNEMHTLNRDVFVHLTELETLILSQNTFRLIDTSSAIAISGLNSLRTLDLSYMELNALPDAIFHSLKELDTLILTGNLFDTLPTALAKTWHLKKLILDENPLKDLDNDNAFKFLGELEYLSISYLPHVSKIGAWALSELQNLTTLKAASNPRLAQIHELAFTKNTSNPEIFSYPPLKQLFLSNNNLTAIGHNLLVHWEQITELDLRFNPWTCDCSNIWLIHTLIKQINNTTPKLAADVTCATPRGWSSRPILELREHRNELLCEKSQHANNVPSIWIGMLVGVLVGIGLTFVALVIYRKSGFGLRCARNPVADRSLYNRANFADDFHI